MYFASKRSLVAVDIGSFSIKVFQLNKTKDGYELAHMGMINVPPDSWVEGEIENVEALSDTLKSLFSSEKIINKNVIMGISGQSVIIKKISVPPMSDDEVGSMITEEAEQYIPFDIDEVNLDYQALRKDGAEADSPAEEVEAIDDVEEQMDVIIVAARKDSIQNFDEVANQAGLRLRVLDLDVFALENIFELNYPKAEGEAIALVNVGGSMTNVNIVEDGVTAFTRDIPIGGNIISEELQMKLEVGFMEAEKLKLGVMFDDFKKEDIIPHVINGIGLIADDLKKTFDLYEQTSDYKISRIFLGGGSTRMDGFDKALSEKLELPTELIKTFRNIKVDFNKFDPDYVKAMEPVMFLPAGLALRMVGDK